MQSKRVLSSAASASSLEPTATTFTSSPTADELDDRLALVLVVLDHQQVANAAVDEARDRGERVLEPFARDGLLEERDRAGLQGLLAAVAARDDVHGDVPRRRVVLQPVEQRRSRRAPAA